MGSIATRLAAYAEREEYITAHMVAAALGIEVRHVLRGWRRQQLPEVVDGLAVRFPSKLAVDVFRLCDDEGRVRMADSLQYRAPSNCGVYFLRCQSFVKIGFASHWEERLAVYRLHNPLDLELLLFLTAPTARDARTTEGRLHRRFESIRFRGEWYHDGPLLRGFINVEARP